MRRVKRLLSLLARGGSSQTGFLDLPYEIRLEIYRRFFANCFIRYSSEYHLNGHHLPIKVNYWKGPKEYNLLATCRQIYDEGKDVLQAHPPYVIIDDVDAELALWALWRMCFDDKNTFLRTLIISTHRLVMSKPAEYSISNPPVGSFPPNFTNLKEVEIFGFYPDLNKWFYRNRAISMGWSNFHWKICWWRGARRPTKNRRIQLTQATKWIHGIARRDASEMKVTLRAWMFDVPQGATKWTNMVVSKASSKQTTARANAA